jgi:hypoxanthine phosphoribosyltransferase
VPLATVAFTAEQIQQRVRDLAGELQKDLAGERPLLVAVLKGSVIFLADLVRNLGVDSDVDFMSISSYAGGPKRSGVVRITKDLEAPLEGRHVIVVEDIIDTGLTLSFLLKTLETRSPASLSVCTLVDKAVRRITDMPIAYAGFESEEFLIGYGLDYRGRYRNLPYLMAVNDLVGLASQPDALTGLFSGGSGGVAAPPAE